MSTKIHSPAVLLDMASPNHEQKENLVTLINEQLVQDAQHARLSLRTAKQGEGLHLTYAALRKAAGNAMVTLQYLRVLTQDWSITEDKDKCGVYFNKKEPQSNYSSYMDR